ncbi:uncharacterized protein BX663DRAFT_28411 [Cokeromyces recurvatus]|uniref:uncharacterized protein n=1 Tax=Cokeromyces recurvatus TaxID=90255 RepID=UPI0022210DCC|nr:uncharacterized protein BX663DRAFT_28411 [Cokeromyces recurvatus]KAI7908323.1 hypothetical protein BX663DRAFT_28411 [Cokeromyces recurvatus]
MLNNNNKYHLSIHFFYSLTFSFFFIMTSLQKRYFKNLKIQTIQNQIKNTGHQYWAQIYSSLFWIISALINHWKLQQHIKNDNDNDSRKVMTIQNVSLHKENKKSLATGYGQQQHLSLPLKKKERSSLFKTYILSLKSKKKQHSNNNKLGRKPLCVLHRLSNNESVYANIENSPPPPPLLLATTHHINKSTLLKSFSFKLKRQRQPNNSLFNVEENHHQLQLKSRLLLSNFRRRKTSVP